MKGIKWREPNLTPAKQESMSSESEGMVEPSRAITSETRLLRWESQKGQGLVAIKSQTLFYRGVGNYKFDQPSIP
jgi:hypothetical protein